MKSKCELNNKLLKKMIHIVSIFLIIFLLGINDTYANFKYSNFDFDEFAEQTKNYWIRECTGTEQEIKKCTDKIIDSQREFYTQLYSLLASKQAKGYYIDDAIIITTVFFEYELSTFNDISGSYNIDRNGDDGENATAEYFLNETDTLKLLINAMIGYERTCYGISDVIIENSDADSETDDSVERQVCREGNVDEKNGTYRCVTKIKTESIGFWEKFSNQVSTFFGIKTSSDNECNKLAEEKGYLSSESTNSARKKVVEEGYWDFLEKGDYFDRKEHLKHRYAYILKDAGVDSIEELDKDKYHDDLVKVRKQIVKEIKSILEEYRRANPDSELNETSDYKFWWPIGSAETTEKNGKLFASENPVSVAITSSFGPRINPVTKEAQTIHRGIDIGNLGGYGESYVIAAKAGTVIAIHDNCKSGGNKKCGGGYGNFIQIQHSNGFTTLYAHLHEGTIIVEKGDSVSQGQVIAKAGSSGSSTGTHLHFEIRTGLTNSTAVDPLEYVDPDDPRPKPAGLIYVDGGEVMRNICLSLKATGFADVGIAAVLTNIQAESAFNPNAIGDSGTSYGLCQWHNERWNNLRNYTNKWQTAEGQLQFLLYELQTGYMSLYNSLLNGGGDANSLANDYCVNFERPADTYTTCSNRAGTYSYTMFNYVNNNCS